MYNVEFTRKASKFLEKSEAQLRERILKAIVGLQGEPFPRDTKRVENQWFENEKVFRIRIGAYRILYVFSVEKLCLQC